MFYNRSVIRFKHDLEQGKHRGLKEVFNVLRNRRMLLALLLSIGYVVLVTLMLRKSDAPGSDPSKKVVVKRTSIKGTTKKLGQQCKHIDFIILSYMDFIILFYVHT